MKDKERFEQELINICSKYKDKIQELYDIDIDLNEKVKSVTYFIE